MIVQHRLPDSTRTDINWDAPCPKSGWPNMVTKAPASDIYYPEHDGTLSVKCAFNGEEVYTTSTGRYSVTSKSYLILNAGRRYASYIESRQEIESFCIFFRPDFAEEALWSLTTPHDRALDTPTGKRPITFLEMLRPHDAIISPVLFAIRSTLGRNIATTGWLEEKFHELLDRMVHAHRHVIGEMQRISAVRPSTRLETYHRLSRARNFMEDNLNRQIGLQDIAAEAFLSPHHFLRLFKEVFRETPHQYLTRRRIEQAQELLMSTNKTVTEICAAVGFQSLGSFSWLFSSRLGVSPVQYRSQRRRSNGSTEHIGSERFVLDPVRR